MSRTPSTCNFGKIFKSTNANRLGDNKLHNIKLLCGHLFFQDAQVWSDLSKAKLGPYCHLSAITLLVQNETEAIFSRAAQSLDYYTLIQQYSSEVTQDTFYLAQAPSALPNPFSAPVWARPSEVTGKGRQSIPGSWLYSHTQWYWREEASSSTIKAWESWAQREEIAEAGPHNHNSALWVNTKAVIQFQSSASVHLLRC